MDKIKKMCKNRNVALLVFVMMCFACGTMHTFAEECTYRMSAERVYDSNDTLTAELRYTYDENGKMDSCIYLDGTGAVQYTGEALWDETARTTILTFYDMAGNWYETRTYDAAGNLIQDKLGEKSYNYYYDQNGGLLLGISETINQGLLYISVWIYSSTLNESGQLQNIHELYSTNWREYEYDENGNCAVVRFLNDSDGTPQLLAYREYDYEAAALPKDSRQITVVEKAVTCDSLETPQYYYRAFYDAMGRQAGTIGFNENDIPIRLEINHYNEDGKVQTVKTMWPSDNIAGLWYLEAMVEMNYDEEGKRKGETVFSSFNAEEPDLWSEFEYNGDLIVKSLTYDMEGLQSWAEYEYDDLKYLTQKTDYNSEGSLKCREEYVYDDSGNLLTVRSYGSENTVQSITNYFYMDILVHDVAQE